jgi:hypothetical protein
MLEAAMLYLGLFPTNIRLSPVNGINFTHRLKNVYKKKEERKERNFKCIFQEKNAIL